MRTLMIGAVCAALMLVASHAQAGMVTVTSGASSLAVQEDFSTLASGVFDGIFDAGNGVAVAESFVGQTVVDPGGSGFESFSGTPDAPLVLAMPDANDGIYGIQGTAGLAGGSSAGDIGEGVVSMLFEGDQTEIGFDVNGSDGGDFTVAFYANDGTLVDTVTATGGGSFTFTSDMAFRGINISNTDGGGIAYDNLRFVPGSVVPEPTSIALWGLGTLGIGVIGRRRQRKPKLELNA